MVPGILVPALRHLLFALLRLLSFPLFYHLHVHIQVHYVTAPCLSRIKLGLLYNKRCFFTMKSNTRHLIPFFQVFFLFLFYHHRSLKQCRHFRQILNDRKVLRADSFALAAPDTVTGLSRFLGKICIIFLLGCPAL